MRVLTAAAAAAFVLSLSVGAAFAEDLDQTQPVVDDQATDTVFDLGIDVSNVGNTGPAVRGFLSQLEPTTRSTILNACDHFMEAPVTAEQRDTLTFCATAVGG